MQMQFWCYNPKKRLTKNPSSYWGTWRAGLDSIPTVLTLTANPHRSKFSVQGQEIKITYQRLIRVRRFYLVTA